MKVLVFVWKTMLLIQDSGEPFNLMRNIPIEADAIEDLMN